MSERQLLRDRCRTILYGYAYGEQIAGVDHEFLLTLITKHPCAEEKIGTGIAHFEVRENPRFRKPSLWLVRRDGSHTDFSFYRCIDGEVPHRSHVRSALRAEIIDQIQDFKAATLRGGAVCAITGTMLDQSAHVDHHEPSFEELSDAFIAKLGGYQQVQITQSLDGDIGRRLVDPFLAVEWQEFHRIHARLRATTAHANLSKRRKQSDRDAGRSNPGEVAKPA